MKAAPTQERNFRGKKSFAWLGFVLTTTRQPESSPRIDTCAIRETSLPHREWKGWAFRIGKTKAIVVGKERRITT